MRIVVLHEISRLTGPNKGFRTPDFRCHDRRSAGKGFQHYKPEAFVIRGDNAYIGGTVKKGQLIVSNKTEKRNRVVYF